MSPPFISSSPGAEAHWHSYPHMHFSQLAWLRPPHLQHLSP